MMKRRNKRQSYLKKLLSVTLVCGLLLTFFVPGLTVSAAEGTLVPETITSGGEYLIPSDQTGTITIATTEPVTLSPETAGNIFENLTINCLSGTDLTINGLKVSLHEDQTIISFTGKENKLRLEGSNELKNHTVKGPDEDIKSTYKSIIHVPAGTELSIYGPGYLYSRTGISSITTQYGSFIGGNGEEKGGTVHVMGGYLISLDGWKDPSWTNAYLPAAFIGGGYKAGMEEIDIRGGRVYGKLGSGSYDDSSVPENERGHVTIDGDCFVNGPIRAPYTFTRGVWSNPGKERQEKSDPDRKQIVRGGSFHYTEADDKFFSSFSKNTVIEEGAQLTLSGPLTFNKAWLINYGTLVINSSVSFKVHTTSTFYDGEPGGSLYNYGTFIVNPDKELTVAVDDLRNGGDSQIINYSSGVIENNGKINFVSSYNVVVNIGEIRGNALEGSPNYDNEFYSSYHFNFNESTWESWEYYPLDKENDTSVLIEPYVTKIKYLDYENVGIRVNSIAHPPGVRNGLTIKEVADDGTVSAVETGKLWNGGKGFKLPKDEGVTRRVKLLGNEPGDYEVTYALVNLEDNSEIMTGTVIYKMWQDDGDVSTLTGITINGKAIRPFDKDTLTYDVVIRADEDYIGVMATPYNSFNGTYKVDAPEVPVEGKNVVTITCYSANSRDNATVYTVNVYRPKLIEGIKTLYLDGKPFEDFDPHNTNSIITISDTQMDSRFTYTLSNPNDQVLSDTLSSKKLRVGNNICMVKIGDSSGALKVQYLITVKVVKGAVIPPSVQLTDNTLLKSVTVNGVSVPLPGLTTHKTQVILTDGKTTAAITAVAKDPYATVTYTASLSLRPGNNLTSITVLSSNKSKQVKYTLCIRYQTLDNALIPSKGASDSTELQAITVGGVQAVIPESGSIIVEVGRITDLPDIVVTTQDPHAAFQIKYLAAKVRTGNNMAQIIVQSSDKSKKTTYTLVYRVS